MHHYETTTHLIVNLNHNCILFTGSPHKLACLVFCGSYLEFYIHGLLVRVLQPKLLKLFGALTARAEGSDPLRLWEFFSSVTDFLYFCLKTSHKQIAYLKFKMAPTTLHESLPRLKTVNTKFTHGDFYVPNGFHMDSHPLMVLFCSAECHL